MAGGRRCVGGRGRRWLGWVLCCLLLGLWPPGWEARAARDGNAVWRLGAGVTVPAGETWGDVVAIGGPVRVAGEATGNVVAVGGSVTVTGRVAGDVAAIGGDVTLGAGAQVGGNLVAVGGTVHRDPGARVLGSVSTVYLGPGVLVPGAHGPHWQWLPEGWSIPWWLLWSSRPWPSGWGWLWHLLQLAGLYAVALLAVTWWGEPVRAVAQSMEANPGRSLLLGLLCLLLLIPLSVVLLITLVGPVLLWVAFGLAKLQGYVATVWLVGQKVARRFWPSLRPVGELTLGVALVALLRYVPWLGSLFSLAVTAWSLGAVLDTRFGTHRPWLPPPRPPQAD